MIVTLYQNMSDEKKVGKNISAVAQLTDVMWKEDTDILHPVITFHKFKDANNNWIWKNFNYCSIEWSGLPTRYYFIDNFRVNKGGIIEIHCRVDVLETWKDFITTGFFLVARQEHLYNKMLVDTRAKVPTTRQMSTDVVGTVGDGASGSIVLTVSG